MEALHTSEGIFCTFLFLATTWSMTWATSIICCFIFFQVSLPPSAMYMPPLIWEGMSLFPAWAPQGPFRAFSVDTFFSILRGACMCGYYSWSRLYQRLQQWDSGSYSR